MKRLLVIIFLLITFKAVMAQEIRENVIYSALKTGDFPIAVGYTLDSGAKVVSYIQDFPNLPTTNFILLKNGQLCRFELSYNKEVNIKDYYFTIVDDLTNQQILDGNLTGLYDQDLYKRTGILAQVLPIISIKDRTIRLTVYNKLKPSELITVVLFNNQLSKVDVQHVNLTYNRSVQLDGDDKNISFIKKSTGVEVVVNKSPYPYIYLLLIREKKSNKVVFKGRVWNHNYYRDEQGPRPFMNVNKSYFENSGDYELILQPDLKGLASKEAQKYSTIKTIHVEVPREYSQRQMLILGFFIPAFLIIAGVALMLWIRRRNARILHEKNQQKKIAELKLQAIRTQLNPHFLFNALSTIQGLINGEDLDRANAYLTKFARLTRSILEREDTQSVSQEIRLLDDYLQMEKLRYGFQYSIKASGIDGTNVEIPSMLLQPIVENAVKHGVAELGESGRIEIDFTSDKMNLNVVIKDNGKGFVLKESYSGLGLKLTNERIVLTNEAFGQEIVFLKFDSDKMGTIVSLTFKNWL